MKRREKVQGGLIFFINDPLVGFFERGKRAATSLHEFGEKLNKLEPGRVNESTQNIDGEIENVTANQNENGENPACRANHLNCKSSDEIDDHGDDASCESEGEEAGITEDIGDKTDDAPKGGSTNQNGFERVEGVFEAGAKNEESSGTPHDEFGEFSKLREEVARIGGDPKSTCQPENEPGELFHEGRFEVMLFQEVDKFCQITNPKMDETKGKGNPQNQHGIVQRIDESEILGPKRENGKINAKPTSKESSQNGGGNASQEHEFDHFGDAWGQLGFHEKEGGA